MWHSWSSAWHFSRGGDVRSRAAPCPFSHRPALLRSKSGPQATRGPGRRAVARAPAAGRRASWEELSSCGAVGRAGPACVLLSSPGSLCPLQPVSGPWAESVSGARPRAPPALLLPVSCELTNAAEPSPLALSPCGCPSWRSHTPLACRPGGLAASGDLLSLVPPPPLPVFPREEWGAFWKAEGGEAESSAPPLASGRPDPRAQDEAPRPRHGLRALLAASQESFQTADVGAGGG